MNSELHDLAKHQLEHLQQQRTMLHEVLDNAKEYENERDAGMLNVYLPGNSVQRVLKSVADFVSPHKPAHEIGLSDALWSTMKTIASAPFVFMGVMTATALDIVSSGAKVFNYQLGHPPPGAGLSDEGQHIVKHQLEYTKDQIEQLTHNGGKPIDLSDRISGDLNSTDHFPAGYHMYQPTKLVPANLTQDMDAHLSGPHHGGAPHHAGPEHGGAQHMTLSQMAQGLDGPHHGGAPHHAGPEHGGAQHMTLSQMAQGLDGPHHGGAHHDGAHHGGTSHGGGMLSQMAHGLTGSHHDGVHHSGAHHGGAHYGGAHHDGTSHGGGMLSQMAHGLTGSHHHAGPEHGGPHHHAGAHHDGTSHGGGTLSQMAQGLTGSHPGGSHHGGAHHDGTSHGGGTLSQMAQGLNGSHHHAGPEHGGPHHHAGPEHGGAHHGGAHHHAGPHH